MTESGIIYVRHVSQGACNHFLVPLVLPKMPMLRNVWVELVGEASHCSAPR